MTCICTRAPRGFAFHRVDIPSFERPAASHACSMLCLDIIEKRKGAMPSPAEMNKIELEAIQAASPAAGEYLEQVGETDLSRLTPEQWNGFLAHTYKAIADEVQRIFADQEVPF